MSNFGWSHFFIDDHSFFIDYQYPLVKQLIKMWITKNSQINPMLGNLSSTKAYLFRFLPISEVKNPLKSRHFYFSCGLWSLGRLMREGQSVCVCLSQSINWDAHWKSEVKRECIHLELTCCIHRINPHVVRGEWLGKMMFAQGAVARKDDFCELCFCCKTSSMCEQVVTFWL